jgi:hypothetical protein
MWATLPVLVETEAPAPVEANCHSREFAWQRAPGELSRGVGFS